MWTEKLYPLATSCKLVNCVWPCPIIQVVELTAEQYAESAARGSPTYDHFFEKLLRLKGMMKTHAGKEAAEARHQVRKDEHTLKKSPIHRAALS